MYRLIQLLLIALLSEAAYSQNPVVRVAGNAPEPELRAARILQYYLGQITGQTVALETGHSPERNEQPVFVGKQIPSNRFQFHAPATIPEDGFYLEGKKGAIWIAGGGELGTEYGVYSFLERLGCRKLSPVDSIIPQIPQLVLPEITGQLEVPAFPYRELWYEPAFDEAWARWNKLKTNPQKNREWGMFVHTFDKLCPKDRYFREHPEYFAYNGAQWSPGQLCLSNDTVLQIVCTSLDSMIRQKPEARYWSVSQNDNFDYCKCPRCAAADRHYGSPAGTLLAFVNKVARRFPDIVVSTLAYQYTRQAPRNIRPEPNVSICLCSIECNRGQSIEAGCGDFARDVREWSALTERLMIWDYVVQFRSYISPFPNWHTLQPNLQFFRNNGVRMIFEQGSGHSRSEFSDMRAYLLARLMWNPDANMDSILTDFGDAYYGGARQRVWEYVHFLTESLAKHGNHLWIYDIPQNEPFLERERLQQEFEKLLSGFAWIGGDLEKMLKLEEATLPLYFAQMEILKTDTSALCTGTASFPPSAIADFADRCRKHGIETLHENNYPPDQYVQDYNTYLERCGRACRNLAQNVTLTSAASPAYARGRAEELVNRLVGETDYRYNWLGFQGNDLQATVELKTPVAESVSVSFLQDQASWVFFPKQVVIEVSEDGQTFQTVHRENIETVPDGKKTLYTVTTSFPLQKVRKMRVIATNLKTCPGWHPCNGNPCWIFADEIIVR